MAWIYEPDPRRKHKLDWTKSEPGFVEGRGGEFVGKCPANMTLEMAQSLLNDSEVIEVPSIRPEKPYPDSFYHIHSGVLYRATWTNPGKSLHGFPEHPARAVLLPKKVKDRILALAERLGCQSEIRKCLNGKT